MDVDKVLVTLALLLLVGLYLSWTAGRLDRLHIRVEAARAGLDTQLVRRASAAVELATSGLLDPASAVVLATAAYEARDASGPDREQAESDLSRAIRAALDDPRLVAELRRDPQGARLLDQLEGASRRVAMARRFYNDVVRSAQVLHGKRVVRYLRLAGRARAPETFEMDDAPPDTLSGAAL